MFIGMFVDERLNLNIRENLSPKYLLVTYSGMNTSIIYEGDSLNQLEEALFSYRNRRFKEMDERKNSLSKEVDEIIKLAEKFEFGSIN